LQLLLLPKEEVTTQEACVVVKDVVKVMVERIDQLLLFHLTFKMSLTRVNRTSLPYALVKNTLSNV